MTQLSIFDVAAPITQEEAVIIQPPSPTNPTFFIDYFDKDEAQRLGWIRAKNESDAKEKFMKENRNVKIKNAYLSDRDFDELEALD